jgi:quercetin dioxygenase-like cupin family protein
MIVTWRKGTILAALLGGLVMAGSAALALDHNDGKDPKEDLSATRLTVEFPSKTILGQDYTYPGGVPLVESFIFEIPVGKQTSLHKHAVPMYAYLLDGELEVDYGSRGKRTFKAGSAYVEAIDWCHFGRTVGNQPVKILGVYLGQKNPNQITPEVCAKPQ